MNIRIYTPIGARNFCCQHSARVLVVDKKIRKTQKLGERGSWTAKPFPGVTISCGVDGAYDIEYAGIFKLWGIERELQMLAFVTKYFG